MNALAIFQLSPLRAEIARMAYACERAAVGCLFVGDRAGAEAHLHASDTYWTAALDRVGVAGAHLDRRTSL